MEDAAAFRLEGTRSLRIEHDLNDQGELSIRFIGNLIVRHGDRFERYLSHLEDLEHLAKNRSVAHVHCHLEDFGEALSRAQHAIYRMLHAMRKQGISVTIYAAGKPSEQSEHLKMSELFVTGLSKEPGPPVKLVGIRQAS